MASYLEMDRIDIAPLFNNDDGLVQFDELFEDMFKQKCLFSISQDNVLSIQKAVECAISLLLTAIIKSEFYQKSISDNTSIHRTVNMFECPVQFSDTFHEANLLKVGSFYENTKNNYPDEFDFIYVLAECDVADYCLMKHLTSSLSDIFSSWMDKYLTEVISDVLPFDSSIEFVSYMGLHGPAAKLEFKLRDTEDESKDQYIFVDISPASRVRLGHTFPDDLRVCYTNWTHFILETGSFIIIKVYRSGHPTHRTTTKIAITETEQNFIKNNMSEDHKQVYRMLKYMLNGNSVNETVRYLIRRKENTLNVNYIRMNHPNIIYDLPSYTIKTMMFHHIQRCRNDARTVSDCIVKVLNELLTISKTSEEQHKSREKQQHCCSDNFFSASVMTMTGDTLEIADDYDSSVEIGKVLTGLVNHISNGVHALDCDREYVNRIPIAEHISDIVQATFNRNLKRYKQWGYWAKSLCIFLLFCCLYVFYLFVRDEHIDMQYCWKGDGGFESWIDMSSASIQSSLQNEDNVFDVTMRQELNQKTYIDLHELLNTSQHAPNVSRNQPPNTRQYNLSTSQYVLNSSQSNTNISQYKTINSSRQHTQYFCVTFNYRHDNADSSGKIGDIRLTNISGLYACETENMCEGKRIFDNQVEYDGRVGPLYCIPYAFADEGTHESVVVANRSEDGYSHMPVDVACLPKESCLNVTKMTYKDGRNTEIKIYYCNRSRICEKTFLANIKFQSCRVNEVSNTGNGHLEIETEVCCCETGLCNNPLLYTDWFMFALQIILLIFFLVLVGGGVQVVRFIRLKRVCCWYRPRSS